MKDKLLNNELRLIRRCARGDKRAWDEFLERYSRLIYNYINRILNTNGWSFAESHASDIFQDIFSLLIKDNCRKLRSFKAKNGCTLASWLRQVTINFTIDYVRKIRSVVSIDEETDDDLSLRNILPDNSNPIGNILSQEEEFSGLKECIDRLDRNQKYFLRLHINKGLRLQELKRHFKLSRGAIDMYKSRLINRLRDCFRRKGFEF